VIVLQVCHSKAWDSKIVTSFWWVYPHQVSKTAPTGEYLTVGSFMIRGKKNFLPPHPLVMGFSILFRLDESSLAAHLNERRVRGEDETLQEIEAESSKKQSNPESDEEIASLKGTDEGTHEDESSRKNTNNQQNNDPGLSDLSTDNGIIKSSETLVPTQAEANLNHGNLTSKEKLVDASVSSQLDDLLDRTLGLGPAKVSVKSSLLNRSPSSLAEDNDDLEMNKPAVKDKPYISKAERRKLKKGQSTGEPTNDSQNGEAVAIETPGTLQQPKSKANTKAASPVATEAGNTQHEKSKGSTNTVKSKVSRGQKGKVKKIKEKYAEQDDEEREIRMALLAVIMAFVVWLFLIV
jgi:hypothetical protein